MFWLTNKVPVSGRLGSAVCGVCDLAEYQPRRSSKELKAADQRKDEFLAMLAHELRNPLAPVRNAVEVLRMIGPSETRLEWARESHRSADHPPDAAGGRPARCRPHHSQKVALDLAPIDVSIIVARAVESTGI